ncbi:MAG: hypothetical protein HY929_00495 [Euryarchaeota archaeon]|nr:hypothetical protein [Euryarchaeota archaeon]
MKKETFEYEILIKNERVSRGKNLKKMLDDVEKKYPNKKISIRCVYPKGIIAVIFLIKNKRVKGLDSNFNRLV